MHQNDQSRDVIDLRRHMRDLAAISSLPAIFVNSDSESVCNGLCDVLIRCLPIDFVLLRLRSGQGELTREVLRASDEVNRAEVESAVAGYADTIRCPTSVGQCGNWRVVCENLGPYAEGGILLVGARAQDFPNEGQRLLLNVAANQAGMMLAQKKSESEAAKLRETLEMKVEERTAHLLEANEQLQSFTYSMAHDLRQYIRGISVNAKALIADAGSSLDGNVVHKLDRLAYSARQLNRLVDDLLINARIARHQPVEQTVDMSALANEVCTVISESGAYPPGILFHIAPSLDAEADPAMLRLVLENLIDNACKFAVNDRDRMVSVGREAGAFYVRDNGLGFDMKYVHKVFLPLERLEGAAFPGTGMGLANVKRIVERHGGRIWAESQPRVGSTFYFTLRKCVLI